MQMVVLDDFFFVFLVFLFFLVERTKKGEKCYYSMIKYIGILFYILVASIQMYIPFHMIEKFVVNIQISNFLPSLDTHILRMCANDSSPIIIIIVIYEPKVLKK